MKNLGVLQNHFMTTHPCKDWWSRFLQETGIICFVPKLCTFRNSMPELVKKKKKKKVRDLTRTCSNAGKQHVCAGVSVQR